MNLRVSGLTTAAAVATVATVALATLGTLASPPALAAAEAGMRAARDAKTGQVRAPTAEESKTLDAAAAKLRSAKGSARVGMASGKLDPQPITHADGTVEQELDASTMSYSVARRNADGTLERVCVQGNEAAAKAMKAPLFAGRPGPGAALTAVSNASKSSKEQLK